MKKTLVKKLKRLTAHHLLVTPKYTAWLESYEGRNSIYPQWVLDRITQVLSSPPRERVGTFGASSSGRCMREQVFAFLGADALPDDMDKSAVFLTGTWNHVMWQAGMLASGAINDIEVPAPKSEFRSMGTLDGRGEHPEHGPFGWEHKSINARSFRFVLARESPEDKHLRQAHRYMLATKLRLWSITYDCKENSDWKEFVVEFDPALASDVMDELIQLNRHVEEETLPPVLEPCRAKKGPYRSCAYRKDCLLVQADEFVWPRDGHRVFDAIYGHGGGGPMKRIKLPPTAAQRPRIRVR